MNEGKPGRPFQYPITFIEWMARLRSANYTTLFRRIQKLNLSVSSPDLLNSDPVVIAVEWMREKWKIRRGWLKVHAMIDVSTNQILSLEITEEDVPELEKRGILSGIKMRKDTATKSRGSPYRSECVRRRNKIGYDKWAEETGYGMRWKVEGLYSSVKRIFGETVRATSKKGMIHACANESNSTSLNCATQQR